MKMIVLMAIMVFIACAVDGYRATRLVISLTRLSNLVSKWFMDATYFCRRLIAVAAQKIPMPRRIAVDGSGTGEWWPWSP